MRVGQIPYLNSVLFYHGLEKDAAAGKPVTLEPLVPRQLSGAVVENAVDAGPVPLVTCWDIADAYEPLKVDGRGDFCIATRSRAISILLFSKRPIDGLGGATIGVSAETSTSVRLMKSLFAHYWRVRPARYTPLDWPNNDAFLLIGDEALIHRRGIKDYPHVVDLGEVWSEWTTLSFVFARWVVKKSKSDADKRGLIDRIDRSIETGWKDLEAIVEPWTHTLNMTTDEMREYLEAFRFRMGTEEYASIERFQQLDEAARAAEATTT